MYFGINLCIYEYDGWKMYTACIPLFNNNTINLMDFRNSIDIINSYMHIAHINLIGYIKSFEIMRIQIELINFRYFKLRRTSKYIIVQ